MLRTLVENYLAVCTQRAKPEKTGCAWIASWQLYSRALSLAEGLGDRPEARQANRHGLRANVELSCERSNRLFDTGILPQLFDTLSQQSLRHQQGGGELVRLHLMGIGCLAGLGVPKGHEGVLVNLQCRLVQDQMTQLVRDAEPLTDGRMSRVDAYHGSVPAF